MTRAKKYLFLTTFHVAIGNKRATSLHKLWTEIPDKYYVTSNIPDPTKRKKCSIERIDSDLRFPTNYSELSYYLSCSYGYRMRSIYGFNPELVQALGYGKQVHNLINLLHKEFFRTNKIPSREKLKQMVEDHFYLRYAAESQKEMLRNSCLKSLENYIELWKDDFTLSVKTEQNFELDFENKALINGSIDMLSHANLQQDVLDVVDFKTGKPQIEFEDRYTHQVVLYAIAAKEALLKNINKAYLHYLDDEKTERKEIAITSDKVAETKKQLSTAIDGIVQNKFPRNALKKTCASCDWKTICPKGN